MSFNQRCPDCDDVSRRDFLKSAAAGTIATATVASLAQAEDAQAKGKAKMPKSETLVTQFYKTLTEEQMKKMAFAFDHPLRSKIDNNWSITKARVDSSFDKDQQAMIRDIFNSLHSPEYAKDVMKQVVQDSGRDGFGRCSVAVFGKPGSGKFEFVLTGRHVTRRADGDSVEGTAFGGPIFYGHAAQGFNEKPDHPGNVYWFQAKSANKLFQALDGKQRKLALRGDPRREQGNKTVELAGTGAELKGIAVSDLSKDQKELARKVMKDVLAPFRKEDVDESMKLIEAAGFDKLHLSYFKNMDIGNDGVWDVWQIEGPSMISFFRGAPHVHAWLNIRKPA